MARPSDTRARIQAVARELFVRQGVQQTSLRQISDELGITKPALYYHFASREDLVRSVIQPLLDDMDRFVADREPGDARTLLEDYFDLTWQHRDIIAMLIRDLAVLSLTDLAERMFAWRRRIISLLLGPEITQDQHIRATVAIGGLADCTVVYAHLTAAEVRPVAVGAALAALGTAGG